MKLSLFLQMLRPHWVGYGLQFTALPRLPRRFRLPLPCHRGRRDLVLLRVQKDWTRRQLRQRRHQVHRRRASQAGEGQSGGLSELHQETLTKPTPQPLLPGNFLDNKRLNFYEAFESPKRQGIHIEGSLWVFQWHQFNLTNNFRWMWSSPFARWLVKPLNQVSSAKKI